MVKKVLAKKINVVDPNSWRTCCEASLCKHHFPCSHHQTNEPAMLFHCSCEWSQLWWPVATQYTFPWCCPAVAGAAEPNAVFMKTP